MENDILSTSDPYQQDYGNEPQLYSSALIDTTHPESIYHSVQFTKNFALGRASEKELLRRCLTWDLAHLPFSPTLSSDGSKAAQRSIQNISLEEQQQSNTAPVYGAENPWFRYDSLVPLPPNHVRLIRVLPSADTIDCSLATYLQADLEAILDFRHPKKVTRSWSSSLLYSFRRGLRYTCLSYRWGPEELLDQMKIVRVNGKQFRVRSNLYDFLEKARACKRYGLFWIDAISINQEDVKERNEQVKVMGQIFKGASSVLVWLGRVAMQNLDTQELRNLRSRVRPCGHKKSYKKYFSTSDLFAVMHSTDLEYWNRTWVVQEMIIGDNCHFWLDIVSPGEDSASLSLQLFYKEPIPHRRFVQAYEHLVRISGKHNSAMSTLLRSRLANSLAVVGELSKPVPLLKLLQLFKHTRCSDPRDRVYGLLSMALEREAIAVDYTRSTFDLLCRVMWACRGTFCICLVHHLLDALELRHDRDWELSPSSIRQLIEKSDCYMPDMECDRIAIKWSGFSVIRSRHIFVHGRGLPPSAKLGFTLQEILRQHPRAKALKTCRCRNALSESWRNKPGLSVCLSFLCSAEAFQGTHIFFEERSSKLQATGVLSCKNDEYSSYDFTGISLVYERQNVACFTVKFNVIGLLQLMSLLPANGTAIHPSKKSRPASYEVFPPVETQVIRESEDHFKGRRHIIWALHTIVMVKYTAKQPPPKRFPRSLHPCRKRGLRHARHPKEDRQKSKN